MIDRSGTHTIGRTSKIYKQNIGHYLKKILKSSRKNLEAFGKGSMRSNVPIL